MAHAFNSSNQKSKASVCNFEINFVYLVYSKMARATMFQKKPKETRGKDKNKNKNKWMHEVLRQFWAPGTREV